MPKLVYLYTESPDQTLRGYINSSLSVFDVNDFQNRTRPEDSVKNIGNVSLCRFVFWAVPFKKEGRWT